MGFLVKKFTRLLDECKTYEVFVIDENSRRLIALVHIYSYTNAMV